MPSRPTLFFPTEEDSKAVEAIERLQDPKVVSPQPIWVFCREDKRPLYEALPGVKEVRTYAPGWTRENLKAVVATGPLPSGSRLLDLHPPSPLSGCRNCYLCSCRRDIDWHFNQEDLNCYYLKGRHGRRGQPSVWGTLLRVLLTRSRSAVRPTSVFSHGGRSPKP